MRVKGMGEEGMSSSNCCKVAVGQRPEGSPGSRINCLKGSL